MHGNNDPRLRVMVLLAALLQFGLGYLILSRWIVLPRHASAESGGRR